MITYKPIKKTQYDVCIIHLADARFYPLFKHQAFTLRDSGLKVAFISWENKKGNGDPNWDGIDCYPIYIPSKKISGKLFFIKYFFYLTRILLKLNAKLYQAIDPPTLWPAKIAAIAHSTKYNYFSLEFFQGIAQLDNRPVIKKIWHILEKTSIKNAKNTGAVCYTMANMLKTFYNIKMPHIIYNVPLKKEYSKQAENSLRKQINISTGTPLMTYKGDVEKARGLSLAIKTLKDFPDIHFVIIGAGSYLTELKKLSKELKINNRIHFIGKVPSEKFSSYLREADLGYVVHEKIGINNHITLPSRIFDYLHAGLPVISSNGPELKNLVNKYKLGWIIDPDKKEELDKAFNSFLDIFPNTQELKNNSLNTAKEFCWKKEQKKYLAYIKEALSQ